MEGYHFIVYQLISCYSHIIKKELVTYPLQKKHKKCLIQMKSDILTIVKNKQLKGRILDAFNNQLLILEDFLEENELEDQELEDHEEAYMKWINTISLEDSDLEDYKFT